MYTNYFVSLDGRWEALVDINSFLYSKGVELISGNILSYSKGFVKSYQAVYLPSIKEREGRKGEVLGRWWWGIGGFPSRPWALPMGTLWMTPCASPQSRAFL